MNTENSKKSITISPEDLAAIGGGAMAYIREIEGREAIRMLGKEAKVNPTARLYCLHAADGTPISISGTREAAAGSAFEHELLALSLH